MCEGHVRWHTAGDSRRQMTILKKSGECDLGHILLRRCLMKDFHKLSSSTIVTHHVPPEVFCTGETRSEKRLQMIRMIADTSILSNF